jgi:hypothetical protein
MKGIDTCLLVYVMNSREPAATGYEEQKNQGCKRKVVNRGQINLSGFRKVTIII